MAECRMCGSIERPPVLMLGHFILLPAAAAASDQNIPAIVIRQGAAFGLRPLPFLKFWGAW